MLPLVLALLTGTTQTAPEIGPDLYPGTHEQFQRSVLHVQELLFESKFDEAAKIAGRLPDEAITLNWKDTNVPANQKKPFSDVRDLAIAEWKNRYPDLKFSFVKAPDADIVVSFEPNLPPNADTKTPAGAVYFSSAAPGEPSLEVILALKRGTNKIATIDRDVYNEVLHAIGRHLGLSPIAGTGTVMTRMEDPYGMRNRVDGATVVIARNNVAAVQKLRKAVATKARITPAIASLQLDPLKVDLPVAVQGDQLDFSLTVVNTGNSVLHYSLVPDCGCFRLPVPGDTVPAGSTRVIRGQIDTSEFPGRHRKELTMFTNDPEQPVRIIPFTFEARPRYRFLYDAPGNTMQVPDEGLVATVYLAMDPDRPFKIKAASVSGKESPVEITPWEGELPDPELNEPSRPRKGYALKMLFSPDLVGGRQAVTLSVETDDPKLPVLHRSFHLQRGIAAMNSQIYFGSVSKKRASAYTLIVRDDKPYKILSARSESKHFTAKVETVRQGHHYRLTVDYLGDAPLGLLNSRIILTTDDPKQPEVIVNVSVNAT